MDGLPYPDAVTDFQTWANAVHQARLMLAGLLLLQAGAVAIWFLSRPPRPEAGALARRSRWILLPIVAGACFGAAGPLLGNLADNVLPDPADHQLLPLAFLAGSLLWLAAQLARSSLSRPMLRLQVASALVCLAHAPAHMLALGRYWDDLVYTLPVLLAASGVVLAAVFVGCRRALPDHAPRDVYDSHAARRLAAGVGVAVALWIGFALADHTLDATRPWRHYRHFGFVHVWNDGSGRLDVSRRETGSETWDRLVRSHIDGRDGHVRSRMETTTVSPGGRNWTAIKAQTGASGPFDLELVTGTGEDQRLELPNLVLNEDEHLRLRIDDEGRIWISRGGEDWLDAALFGEETLVTSSR